MRKGSTVQSSPTGSQITPQKIATRIRRALKDGGSAEHARGVQWFFKGEVKSHGWYTADLRRAALRSRREITNEHGFDFLVEVADHLFFGSILEEKIAAVFLLEKLDNEFGEREFQLFSTWLERVSSWADHDAQRALSDCAHGVSETGTHQIHSSVGKVAESLATESGLCSADSRYPCEDVLPRD
jgi:DNA alkylation repair enzyme